jgi:hypothetical protein
MRRLLATSVALLGLLGLSTGCGGSDTPGNPTPGTSTAAAATTPAQVATASAAATTAGSGGSTGGTQASDWPSPEDCVAYNPNNLTKAYEAGIWVIKDGASEVMRLHGGPTENLGDKGLGLAKRFAAHCYIGRNNHREEKYSYIFDYWRGPTGVNTTIPEEADACSPYNRANISVDAMGDDAFRVKDHDHVLHAFDTRADADNGKLVLAKYSQICFIGNAEYNSTMGEDVVNYMR